MVFCSFPSCDSGHAPFDPLEKHTFFSGEKLVRRNKTSTNQTQLDLQFTRYHFVGNVTTLASFETALTGSSRGWERYPNFKVVGTLHRAASDKFWGSFEKRNTKQDRNRLLCFRNHRQRWSFTRFRD